MNMKRQGSDDLTHLLETASDIQQKLNPQEVLSVLARYSEEEISVVDYIRYRLACISLTGAGEAVYTLDTQLSEISMQYTWNMPDDSTMSVRSKAQGDRLLNRWQEQLGDEMMTSDEQLFLKHMAKGKEYADAMSVSLNAENTQEQMEAHFDETRDIPLSGDRKELRERTREYESYIRPSSFRFWLDDYAKANKSGDTLFAANSLNHFSTLREDLYEYYYALPIIVQVCLHALHTLMKKNGEIGKRTRSVIHKYLGVFEQWSNGTVSPEELDETLIPFITHGLSSLGLRDLVKNDDVWPG